MGDTVKPPRQYQCVLDLTLRSLGDSLQILLVNLTYFAKRPSLRYPDLSSVSEMPNPGEAMSSPCAREATRTLASSVGTDRRTEQRFSCPRLVRTRRVTVPESAFRLSIVKDVSATGIGLLLTTPLPPGTLLEIEAHGQS